MANNAANKLTFILGLMLISQGIVFAENSAPTTVKQPVAANAVNATNSSTNANDFIDSLSINTMPLSYAFVDGDQDKFRSMEWRNDGYIGGAPEYEMTEGSKDDVYFEATGHDIFNNGDFGNDVELSKKGLGFVNFKFDQFRKYYDGTGGVDHRFSNYAAPELDRKLSMDIGKVEVEAGLRKEGLPDVTFRFEHEYRDGAKSRLTWATVTEGAIARNIAPSWQELKESVNVYELEVEHTIAGYDLKAEQRFEDISIESRRYELRLTDGALGTDVSRGRVQDQEPDSFYSGTGFRVEKWGFNDKLHSSAGYHFQHVKTDEIENMKDYSNAGAPACFTANCENKFGAFSSADSDIHDYMLSFNTFPMKDLNLGAKFKFEAASREAHSDYPMDTTIGFDGVINRIDKSYTEDYASKFGGTFSARYQGISKTSVFSDLDVEQIRDRVMEDRDSIGVQTAGNANEIFSRETIVTPKTAAWTTGLNYSPSYQFSVIPQLRFVHVNENYDDLSETVSTASGAKSAFMDRLRSDSAQFSTRASYRPFGWLMTGAKYQLWDTNYTTRVEGEGKQETQQLTNVYSFDVNVYPREDVTLSSILSLYKSEVDTPSPNRTNAFGNFNSNVATWMFGADYYPIKDINLSQNIFYSWANNFQDLSEWGVPYGASFNRVGYTIRLEYWITKALKFGPLYSFDHYGPNTDFDTSKYNAHLVGFDLGYNWK